MVKLLNEEYRRRINVIDKDIDPIYTKLQPFKTISNFKEHEERIKKHLDIFTQDTLATKEKKFWRDKRAFQDGKDYRWHQGNRPVPQRNRQTNQMYNEKVLILHLIPPLHLLLHRIHKGTYPLKQNVHDQVMTQ